MPGRPITVHTRAAKLKRERMRRYRAAAKQNQPSPIDARPLADTLKNWSRT